MEDFVASDEWVALVDLADEQGVVLAADSANGRVLAKKKGSMFNHPLPVASFLRAVWTPTIVDHVFYVKEQEL